MSESVVSKPAQKNINDRLTELSKPAMKLGITFLNRLSGSPVIQRMGLNEPAKDLLYQATKFSLSVASEAQSAVKEIKKLLPEERPKKPKPQEPVFDLTPTEEQQMIIDMVKDFAAEVLRPASKKADEDHKIPKEVFDKSYEAGLTMLGLPEALGGASYERSYVTGALIAEELAYGDFALALALTSSLGFVNTLVEFGSLRQMERFLSAFGEENAPKAAIAHQEKKAIFNPNALSTKAERNHSGYWLNGEKTLVPLAERADYFLVSADLTGRGPSLFIVNKNSPGLSVQTQKTMGLNSAEVGDIRLKNVFVPKENILGEKEVEFDYKSWQDLLRVGKCALASGTARAVVDYVIQYANERVAFGEPISNRQAVAFMIADMATEMEAMRLLTWRAASRAENSLDFHKEALLADVQCSQYSMQIGTNGVQILGGHGYTKEHPVELWYRQLRSVGVLQGGFAI